MPTWILVITYYVTSPLGAESEMQDRLAGYRYEVECLRDIPKAVAGRRRDNVVTAYARCERGE